MTKPIIEIENISKRYRIGAHKEPYLSLRDEVARTARRITASLSRLTSRQRTKDQGQSETDFWALQDVSFSVKEGEAVGIIGRNGAGKSTLLKILSQITPPTKGRIICRGRIASLLEVGTGFHPELTGRENIFLNGTILGMTRREVKRKFDEIVVFSEVEKFLDTPVKRYSSGMYVRLAFAVAAHLEPEILIVDEVLAVGDAQFQKKCLGKMNEVAKGGRTVLFVSHNMTAILNLCNTGVLIDGGQIISQGDINKVVEKYLCSRDESNNYSLANKSRTGSMAIKFDAIAIENKNGGKIIPGCPVAFKMQLNSSLNIPSNRVTVAIGINTIYGERLIELHTKCDNLYQKQPFSFSGCVDLSCSLPALPLKPGKYILTYWVDYDGIVCDVLKDQIQLEVFIDDYYKTGFMPSQSQGWLVINQNWSNN